MAKNAGISALKLRSGDAFLIIDLFNHFKFPGGNKLAPWALRAAPKIKSVQKKFHKAGLPVIFANDNHSLWNASPKDVINFCARKSKDAKVISGILSPSKKDSSVALIRLVANSETFPTGTVFALSPIKPS